MNEKERALRVRYLLKGQISEIFKQQSKMYTLWDTDVLSEWRKSTNVKRKFFFSIFLLFFLFVDLL